MNPQVVIDRVYAFFASKQSLMRDIRQVREDMPNTTLCSTKSISREIRTKKMMRPNDMKCCDNCKAFSPTEYLVGKQKIEFVGYCRMEPVRQLVHVHHYCFQWENNYEEKEKDTEKN